MMNKKGLSTNNLAKKIESLKVKKKQKKINFRKSKTEIS